MPQRINMSLRKVITLSDDTKVTIKPLRYSDRGMIAQAFKVDDEGYLIANAERVMRYLANGIVLIHGCKDEDPLEVMQSWDDAGKFVAELVVEVTAISKLPDDEAAN